MKNFGAKETLLNVVRKHQAKTHENRYATRGSLKELQKLNQQTVLSVQNARLQEQQETAFKFQT